MHQQSLTPYRAPDFPQQLLWIDDQKTPADPDVEFLKRAGFGIECATTGASGLILARTLRYCGILLDLRLPDIPGLSVLATLRAEKIDTPVLVLTGWGDFESARVAGAMGVVGFESKPLFLDELEAAIRRLVRVEPRQSTADVKTFPSTKEFRAAFSSIARVLERLERISPEGILPSDYRHPELRRELTVVLIRAVADPGLSMEAFLASAAALKRLLLSPPVESPFELARKAERLILEALAKSEPSKNVHVTNVIAKLRSAASGERVKLATIGDSVVRMSPERLGKLIEEASGFCFTHWRTGFLIRPSLSPLLNTDDDVKQIIGRLPVFRNVDHFGHEFRRFLGLTPTKFRQLGSIHSNVPIDQETG